MFDLQRARRQCYNCNIGTFDLPNVWLCPQALGMHTQIRQIPLVMLQLLVILEAADHYVIPS